MILPREIAPSRWKTLASLAISLVFVAIALFLPRDGGDETWRYLCLFLFGAATIVFAILLARPQRLLLDADGFTVTGGLTRSARRVRWRDVEGFAVRTLPRGGSLLCYTLVPAARRDTYWGDLNRRLGGDGVLPRTLIGSPATIAAQLEAYRQAALRGTALG